MLENERPKPRKGDIGKLRFPEYLENIYILIVFLKISCHRSVTDGECEFLTENALWKVNNFAVLHNSLVFY